MNYFLDHNSPNILMVVMALIGFASIVLLLYKKEYLLYILAFTVPLTLPVSIFGRANVNFPSELICVLLSAYVCIRFCINYKADKAFLKHPVTIVLAIDLLWLLITSHQSSMPDVSYKRFIIRFIYIFTYYIFFYELFKADKKNIILIFSIHCVGMLWPIFVAFDHHKDYGFSTGGANQACQPFYNDHTIYGAALVFFIPFLFYNAFYVRRKLFLTLFYRSLLLLFVVAAFLSFSRAALASLLIAFIIFLVIKLKIKAVYLVICVLLFLSTLFIFRNDISEYSSRSRSVSQKNDVGMHFKSMANVNTDVSNTERINRWKCAWKMFKEKPMFGFGPGTYQFFYGQFQVRKDMTHISTFQGDKGHAHSEYLGYLSETGLLGAINFLLLVIFVCTKALRVINTSRDKEVKAIAIFVFMGLITYFIHGFFNGFIEGDKIAMPVFVSIAAIVSLDIANREKAKAKN
ncbi:MAG: O-antigen ligase family protein [Bacteroidetes bacterium]|nr:O-antigen ligase family protein [Bacteroidota bacterium]